MYVSRGREVSYRICLKPQIRVLIALLSLFSMFWLGACAPTLSKDLPKSESYAFEPSREGILAQVAGDISTKFGKDKSGFLAIPRNDDALTWRLALVDHAQHSIDAQYFIWLGDEAGSLLALRLLRAADRGVRVRLLIDDLALPGKAKAVAALDSHPNFEIRVFNPWERRGGYVGKGFEFLGRMKHLNHRMHNKLFVADNHFAIVGGRNIGNEYFGLSKKYNWSDLDVLCVGPIAKKISKSFDIYWNSEWAYPGAGYALGKSMEGKLEKLTARVEKRLYKKKKLLSHFPLKPKDWSEKLNSLPEIMSGGTAKVVYDEPLVGEKMPPVQMLEGLEKLLDDAQEDVFVITPYLVPLNEDLKLLKETTEAGVRVRILTNSLGSTDSAIVHSVYRRYRQPIVETGAELYEVRHDAEVKMLYDTPPVRAKHLGFHTKAIIIDHKQVYVGSSNLDPRSVYLNTEIGVVINDPVLADELARLFERDLTPENSWRVTLDKKGKLVFKSSAGTQHKEPVRSHWQRWSANFYSLLPVEDQV